MARSFSTRGTPSIRLLLDTSFCLRLMDGGRASLRQQFEGYVPGEVAVSSLTVALLRTRVQDSSDPATNQRALDQFLMPLIVVDFDADAANRLGAIIGWWHGCADGETGHTQMLAAQAIELGATLATCQPELYAPAPSLRLDTTYAESASGDWLAAPVMPHLPAPSRTPGAIIAIGSHDMTLDLLGDSLHAEFPTLTLISAHVGSLNGLLALQRGEAHLAGVHLLDAESGRFNIDEVERLLASHGISTVLVGFVKRVQGLIVARGNPKQIVALNDLLRDDITFVNRQQGAGTRVLLDYHLRRQGVDTQQIRGYTSAESSHLTVAMAVASGTADCGLGIQAAAQAHNLGFVPLFDERYDLAMPRVYFEGPLLAPLLDLLRRPRSDFLQRVAALGGYSTDVMGQVMAEAPASQGGRT